MRFFGCCCCSHCLIDWLSLSLSLSECVYVCDHVFVLFLAKHKGCEVEWNNVYNTLCICTCKCTYWTKHVKRICDACDKSFGNPSFFGDNNKMPCIYEFDWISNMKWFSFSIFIQTVALAPTLAHFPSHCHLLFSHAIF